jgi:NADPH:quinone reductase-like Zn-dependent oxidoreductase
MLPRRCVQLAARIHNTPALKLPQIPSNISFDEAASIPVCLAAAGLGLFGPRPEGLQSFVAPWSGGEGKYYNESIVIVGGSSSVGQYSEKIHQED